MKKGERIAILGRNTIYKGNLIFKNQLKIKGRYYGSISSEGTLVIDAGAYFEGDIKVKNTVVSGHIVGDVVAEEKIEILADSIIKGNLKAPVIRVADGVKIEGRCQMIQDSDSIDIFSTSVKQLKKSVTIV